MASPLRDFIYGFPINWEASAAQCVGKESSHGNHEYFSECFLPAALDVNNCAQLHDLVISLTDTQREVLSKKMCDNLMGMINPEIVDGMNVQPSKSNPSSLVDADILVTPKASNKWRLDTLSFSYTEQEVGVASVSSCSDGFLYDVHIEQEGGLILLSRPRENCLDLVEIDNDGTLYSVEVMEDLQPKLQPCQKLGKDALTSRKPIYKRETETMNFEIGETVITSEASTKEGAVAKPATVVLTSRNHVCISVKNLREFRD